MSFVFFLFPGSLVRRDVTPSILRPRGWMTSISLSLSLPVRPSLQGRTGNGRMRRRIQATHHHSIIILAIRLHALLARSNMEWGNLSPINISLCRQRRDADLIRLVKWRNRVSSHLMDLFKGYQHGHETAGIPRGNAVLTQPSPSPPTELSSEGGLMG